MKRSEAPYQELDRAKQAIEAMRSSASLDEFEENWKEYLRRIERMWNKLTNHYCKSPKWHSWHGQYARQRKNDGLLSYLINARGAEEHTVQEIVAREGGGIGINPAFGNRIDFLEINSSEGRLNIKTTQPLKIEFIPGKTKLLPVTNRGRTYSVPTSHLGSPINPSNVISLAELALAYYGESLKHAEAFFVK